MCFWMDSAICGGSSAESRCVASDGGSMEGISALVDGRWSMVDNG
jgi:hypothetical protein